MGMPTDITNFHDLYQRQAADLYRFAHWLTGDRQAAEEIVAETFARALTTDQPLRAATVKGYLLTIARNLYLESRRKAGRQVELVPELADSRAGPEILAEQRGELEAVFAQLQQVAEIDRTALLLRAQGLPYDEIAAILHLTLSSVKVKVHRVRLKLLRWRAARDLS
jgi:RNA polymerase sigma-70 factor, ECF subfamily